MIFFQIDSHRPQNQNSTLFTKSYKDVEVTDTTIFNNFKDGILPDNTPRLKQEIKNSDPISRTNSTKTVRITKNTSAIREDQYLYYDFIWREGYPQNASYQFCREKIATVFANQSKHWTSSYVYKFLSYKTHNFSRVIDRQNYQINDNCPCLHVDFAGVYKINSSVAGDSQLTYSSNNEVDAGTVSINLADETINLKLYSRTTDSYVNIKFKIPLRWDSFHNEWTYNNDLVLYNYGYTFQRYLNIRDPYKNIPSTENYAEIVDCCINDGSSLTIPAPLEEIA